MEIPSTPHFTKRYQYVTEEKAGGVTYTPKLLADFVASQIVDAADLPAEGPIRVLDPAVGEGELLSSLLDALPKPTNVEVYGFDTNENAFERTKERLRAAYPDASVYLTFGNFLDFVIEGGAGSLFSSETPDTYDLVIANPPYVRTQIMGAEQARKLAEQFDLKGRVDLYYPFILGIAQVLRPHGTAGIIVSNRFMTTKAGADVRRAIRTKFRLRHVWDLGDTKLFDAAVLPAVLLAAGRNGKDDENVGFTSIYETDQAAERSVETVIDALSVSGTVSVADGRSFQVKHGVLDDSGSLGGIWRLATVEGDAWLATVDAHTAKRFRDVGKIRVGVKTCADKVFIRQDWDKIPEGERPELLRPLATHHIARRFKADTSKSQRQIVYPHCCVDGRRTPVNLDQYPRTRRYLELHRETLQGRKYVLEAGRNWYEIWVPQDPAAWDKPKLVFRDISEQPCFWIDRDGSVVNGDCYWMICEREEDEDLLWLAAAVGNSSFIEAYYDHRFNNKLYAGRRRFITQYVEQFPLPDPSGHWGQQIIAKAKKVYDVMGTTDAECLEKELDSMVWTAFGLSVEEVAR